MKPVGICREVKSRWERRAPLTPEAVRRLVEGGTPILVQPSEIRVYSEKEYADAGAEVAEDLSPCGVVFGVKEMPPEVFREGVAYVFFSHTIKGQEYNMPMLRRMMGAGCHLIDYERIVDAEGRRLVLFGRHAGLSGMIETLRAAGLRLRADGFETPLGRIRSPYEYGSLDEAKRAVSDAAGEIRGGAWPDALSPFVVGFAGYGNVSRGAQEIYALLDPREVAPADLAGVRSGLPAAGPFVQVVFREEDMVVPVEEGHRFDLQEYYAEPEKYRGVFARYLPHLSALVNATYWDERYPRLVTNDDLRRAWSGGEARLRVIGDISCDLGGGIECTYRATEPDEPCFVYEPLSGRHIAGVAGRGPAVMAVDILPSELPREASEAFSEALTPLVGAIARADLSLDPEEAGLPEPVRQALILRGGKLTEPYRYLAAHLAGD